MDTRKITDFYHVSSLYQGSAKMPSNVRLGWTIAVLKAAVMFPPSRTLRSTKFAVEWVSGDGMHACLPKVKVAEQLNKYSEPARVGALNGASVRSLGWILAQFWGLKNGENKFSPVGVNTVSMIETDQHALDHLFSEIHDLDSTVALALRDCLSLMVNASLDQYYDWDTWIGMIEPLLLQQTVSYFPESSPDFMRNLDGHLRPLKRLVCEAGGRLQVANVPAHAMILQQAVSYFHACVQHDLEQYKTSLAEQVMAIFYVASTLVVEVTGLTLSESLNELEKCINNYLTAYQVLYQDKGVLNGMAMLAPDKNLHYMVELAQEKAEAVYQSHFKAGLTLFGLRVSLASLSDDQAVLAESIESLKRIMPSGGAHSA